MSLLNPLFLIPFITGPIYMLMGWIMLKKPPKTVNSLYGYRTGSSVASQERWDFAQPLSGKEFLKWGGVLTLSALTGLFLNVPEGVGLVLAILLLLLFTAIPIVRTEKAIRVRFQGGK